jgi:hypothetical protein
METLIFLLRPLGVVLSIEELIWFGCIQTYKYERGTYVHIYR